MIRSLDRDRDVRAELLLAHGGGSAADRTQVGDDPVGRQVRQVQEGDDRAGAVRQPLQPARADLRRRDRQGRGEDARRAVAARDRARQPGDPPHRRDGAVPLAALQPRGRRRRRRDGDPLLADPHRAGRAELPRRGLLSVTFDATCDGVDWAQAKADLAADDFDNGRSPEALRRSFEQSQHVAFARDGNRVVGMARLLSDGVCNAYLIDVWTLSSYRRRGIASTIVRMLCEQVPGQNVGLQTDDAQALYASLGFEPQPEHWSLVVGRWLDNDANR